MYHFAVHIPSLTQAFILASVAVIVAMLHLMLRRLLNRQASLQAPLQASAVDGSSLREEPKKPVEFGQTPLQAQMLPIAPPIKQTLYTATAVLIVYLLGLAVLSRLGFFQDFIMPPRILPAVLLTIVVLLFIVRYVRRNMPNTASGFTLREMTIVQVWRFLPEAIILLLIQDGIMPDIMTFTGRNFDIFAPLTAPLMALMIRKESTTSVKLLLVWNIVCSVILFVTVSNGMLAAPTPMRLIFTDIPNAVIGSFPATLLPLFMVPLAFVIHGWSIRMCVRQLRPSLL